MGRITVRVGNRGDLRKLARRFRTAGSGGLQRDLTAGIARPSRPVLTKVRGAVRGAEFGSTRGGSARPDTSTGLRRQLAMATEVRRHGIGVRFEVHGSRVDARYGHRLAKLSDTTLAPRWRHPVFQHAGRESTRWTTQVGQPWFFVPIQASRPQFAGGVRQAMETTARKITG